MRGHPPVRKQMPCTQLRGQSYSYVAPLREGFEGDTRLRASGCPSARPISGVCKAKLKPMWDVHSRGEKIGLVLPVKPSNPRLENDPAGPLALHYLRISLWLWFRSIGLG
jgi:hypothetical protein